LEKCLLERQQQAEARLEAYTAVTTMRMAVDGILISVVLPIRPRRSRISKRANELDCLK
jgi:hypothetical protein